MELFHIIKSTGSLSHIVNVTMEMSIELYDEACAYAHSRNFSLSYALHKILRNKNDKFNRVIDVHVVDVYGNVPDGVASDSPLKCMTFDVIGDVEKAKAYVRMVGEM